MLSTTMSIIAATLLGEGSRSLTRRVFPNQRGVIHLTDEFTGQLCTSVLYMEVLLIHTTNDNTTVKGAVMSACALFFYHLIHDALFIRRNLNGNPLRFISSYYDCGRFMDSTSLRVLSVLIAQLAGVAAGKEFSKLLWRFEDDLHRSALQGELGCRLSERYSLFYASLVEGVGVFLVVVVSHFATRRWKTVVIATVSTGVFLTCAHVSGMFMNPAVAMGLAFGCHGNRGVGDHLLVYWVSPVVGMVLAKEITTKMR